MIHTINAMLSGIGMAQCAFIIAVLLIRRQKIADYILCGWLAILGIISMNYFILNSLDYYFWPMSIALYTTISVLMYLYSKYIVDDYKKFNRKDWLHLAAPAFMVVFIFVTNTIPFLACENLSVYVKHYSIPLWIFRQYFAISTIMYFYFALRKLVRFRKHIYDAYSYNEQQLQLNWLFAIFFFHASYIVVGIIIGVKAYTTSYSDYQELVLSIITLILIYLLSFGGIFQKQLVQADSTNKSSSQASKTTAEQINPSPIGGGERGEAALKPFADKLVSYIEDSKAWRDSELSIAKLSDATGIQKHLITQTLNDYIGKNFYTLINGYRVDDAKRMLRDEEYKNYTYLSIAFDCGFNSKSAFYKAFKNITGTTPTEYQKEEID